MEFARILSGQEYGARLKVGVGQPIVRVRVLEKVQRTKQVKVRHCGEPHEGMEEFLHQRNIVVPWKERRPFLSDEGRLEAVFQASADYGDQITEATVQLIFESSGESDVNVHSRGRVSGHEDALFRFASRAGVTDLTSLDATFFIDRFRTAHLSLRGGELLARAFAAAEPDSVTMYVAAHEQELLERGYDPYERFWHDELRKQRPAFALARAWAGPDAERDRLSKEIARLRNLVEGAVRDLRRAGRDSESAALHRQLIGR